MSKEQVSQVVNVTRASTPWSFLIGLVFVVLKLTGHVAWSWWIVTLPFYIGFLLFAVVMGIMLLMTVVAFTLYVIFKAYQGYKKKPKEPRGISMSRGM